MMVVLLIDQTGRQLAGMVIVNERDHRHLFALGPFGLFADQPIADQVSDGFAARRIALGGISVVKRVQQRTFE